MEAMRQTRGRCANHGEDGRMQGRGEDGRRSPRLEDGELREGGWIEDGKVGDRVSSARTTGAPLGGNRGSYAGMARGGPSLRGWRAVGSEQGSSAGMAHGGASPLLRGNGGR
jgi:hypothetical protein